MMYSILMRPMQSTIADLLFPENTCYQIPPFQRNYQWGPAQIHRLVKDINAATFEIPSHWIGVALVGPSAKGCSQAQKITHNCKDVLDGQQRLITLRLWCTALIDEFIRTQGREPTLMLSNQKTVSFDRSGFINISVHALDSEEWLKIQNQKVLHTKKYSTGSNSAILQAYLYFRYILLVGVDALLTEDEYKVPENNGDYLTILESWLASSGIEPIGPSDIENLLKCTIEKLDVSVLEHEQDDEDIEVIFETLNSARVELGQFDLFRNYLLINSNAHGKEQSTLYTKHMASGEKNINSAVLNVRKHPLDKFLYDFLIGQAVNHTTIKADATAKEFKKYWDSLDKDKKNVKEFLHDTLTPAMTAWLTAISPGHSQKGTIQFEDNQIDRTLMRIESLSRGPFTPLTTRLILDWSKLNSRSESELLGQLKLVEIFAVRSLLAGIPFSPMRRNIMSACVQIFQSNELTLAEWVVQNSPVDQRIRSVLTQSVAKTIDTKLVEVDPIEWLLQNDFYSRADNRQIRAIFDGIVEHQEGKLGAMLVSPPTKKQVNKNAIWIEHLFPQNDTKWSDDLIKWKTDAIKMNNRLDAIGNIAVLPMSDNITLSNKPLKEKQTGLYDLKVPNWKMLRGFLEAAKWTEIEIDARTIELTNLCLEIWKLPQTP